MNKANDNYYKETQDKSRTICVPNPVNSINTGTITPGKIPMFG